MLRFVVPGAFPPEAPRPARVPAAARLSRPRSRVSLPTSAFPFLQQKRQARTRALHEARAGRSRSPEPAPRPLPSGGPGPCPAAGASAQKVSVTRAALLPHTEKPQSGGLPGLVPLRTTQGPSVKGDH